MSTPRLYIREKSPSGPWRYRRVKVGRGVKTGDITGPFFARPSINGKQLWKPLFAATFRQAEEEARHDAAGVAAQSQEFTVAQVEPIENANRLPLATAIETYLEQKAASHSRRLPNTSVL